mmetsp:Transcript_7622/g.16602  ORF Transcript_7622/g.16602 Transcript_7622/m.16602 type:complete len:508 (+) Transcript_7622:542-2065(+)
MMEEEIPTSSYLLRMIPRSAVEGLGLSYGKFVFSATMRLFIGYLFLINVFLTVVQSDRVLDMFYDMLALNFVAVVDDIAFQLAKVDVMGKHIRNATSSTYFHIEFQKRPFFFRRKMTIFTKLIYVFNLVLFLGGVLAIGVMQRDGYFQCKSVTVTFGEDIWEKAFVEISPGQYDHMVLVYSYFNGVYMQEGKERHEGRPVYREVNKYMNGPWKHPKVGAEIRYCDGAWVFTHPNIMKSNSSEESDCNWLLRSPDTDAYNLLEAPGGWSIWVGVIMDDASIKTTCSGCNTDTDCNLHGQCIDGNCNCRSNAGYYGLQCELEDPCPVIAGDLFNDVWSIIYHEDCEPVQEYGRPVYALIQSDDVRNVTEANMYNVSQDDLITLVFSGSRWFVHNIRSGKNVSFEDREKFAKEYHAFWDRAYYNGTMGVSDPTTKSYPVGVDFYHVGERGPQYGPLGVLYPMQEPPGKGAFRCDNNRTIVAPEGFGSWMTSCHNQSETRVHMDHSHWVTP